MNANILNLPFNEKVPLKVLKVVLSKGSLKNNVEKILDIFDPLLPLSWITLNNK